MGTVSVRTFVAPAALGMTYGTSLAIGNITFSWTGDAWCGVYKDTGAGWVYLPSGTLAISEPTPAETTVSTKIVNGAEHNPTNAAQEQGFDENGAGWNAARPANFPIAAAVAGDVVVKAKYKAGWVAARDGVVDEYAALFVVSSIPAENSFSPAAISWTGRTTKDASVVNVASWVSANCPSYDTSGHAAIVSYTDLMARLDLYNPVMGMNVNSTSFYQDMAPADSAGTTGNAENYGQWVAGVMGAAALALCSSSFNSTQKAAIATRLISHGKQWYDALVGGGYSYTANGGHYQWHLVPMAIYLHATGQTAALATLIADTGGNYDGAFQVTADMLANDFVPHTSTTKPFTWRQRTLPTSSVSGTTISLIPSYAQDPYYGDFTGLLIKRVSDGASATVTATTKTDGQSGSSTYTITIDSQPTPAFAPTDVIYFETPQPLSAGEYDWSIEGYGARYNPSPSATYRDLNLWSGQVLGLVALGCLPTDASAVQGYVEAANTANTPAAGFDFPTHHATFYNLAGTSYAWEAEFWTDHAATILA